MKRIIPRHCVVAVLLLATAPARAEQSDTRATDLAAANTALNATYQTIMAQQADTKDKTALRDLERAWIGFKDKECLFEIGGGDGTVQHPGMAGWPNYADCELRVTKARTEELKALQCVGVSTCTPHTR